eukprot:Hpha_TRINITY_DN15008_c2_g22::TRINITY_DN15008_c2_g22_i1::g.123944::m.123944/K01114/plc; phospholipase C
MKMSAAFLIAGMLGFASAKQHNKIKHIVVLMEENRAFDHMMGWFPGVNGLKGDEFNPYDTKDPSKGGVKVSKNAPYISPWGPNHCFNGTKEEIFGKAGEAAAKDPTMDGFVETHYLANKSRYQNNWTIPMDMFTPERLPVMKALADNFAVFDRYFCSVPGPTWPNRIFQLMGTSKGDTKTHVWHPYTGLYFGKTVFDQIEEVGLDWKFYYADAPLEMALLEKILANPLKVHGWERFKKDIAKGELPAFSWVNPRWFVNKTSGEGCNSQHPDHDVRLGEALMKEVYESLRAGPAWNETLFIITYDEHGGFYDHVPPPMDIPQPDDSKSFPDEGFDFKRSGVRIPTLLISPWVSKGLVIGKPDGPTPTSEYELSSVIATAGKLFGFNGFLTKRDAWAGTFEMHLNESSPRSDCPMTLPDAPKSLGAEHAAAEAAKPLSELHEDIVEAFKNLRGDSPLTQAGKVPTLQGDASEWISQVTQEIMQGKHVYSDLYKRK